MIHIVAGNTGVGKTKQLIEMANSSILKSKGSIVYIDKSHKHMYDLNHNIRFISLSDYTLTDHHEFYGFICGVISEDHDIETIYLDGLLKLAKLTVEESTKLIHKLKQLSEKFSIHFVISLSCNCQLPDHLKAYLVA